MFRRLTMAIFRLYMKYLVSSYTGLNMGCIQWGGRSCHGGWEVWVHVFNKLEQSSSQLSHQPLSKFVHHFLICCTQLAVNFNGRNVFHL